jgi:hypothetical protein
MTTVPIYTLANTPGATVTKKMHTLNAPFILIDHDSSRRWKRPFRVRLYRTNSHGWEQGEGFHTLADAERKATKVQRDVGDAETITKQEAEREAERVAEFAAREAARAADQERRVKVAKYLLRLAGIQQEFKMTDWDSPVRVNDREYGPSAIALSVEAVAALAKNLNL